MAHADFVHLRVHTAYSLLEGAIRVPELVGLARQHGMPAVAMTDTNNLFGAMDFSAACAAAGIQPIVGCQLSVFDEDARPGRGEGNGRGNGASPSRALVVLVQNEAGYQNLLRLLKLAYLDGEEATDPRIPLAALGRNGEGLLALTGGPRGLIGRSLAEGRVDEAEATLRRLVEAFPNRLYVELQRHGLDSEGPIENGLIELAYRHDVPLVATNEAFFTNQDMFEAHDALTCIAGSAYVSEPDRKRLTPEHCLKSAAEMRALFSDLPEAVDNTLVVARRCAFMVEKRNPILPPYDCGEGRNEADELKALARDGLEARLDAQVFAAGMSEEEKAAAAKPYRERLDYELDVIIDMGFAGYFLIVAEFIRWAKAEGIPVGPGRGSGAGSVVAWSLTITDLDPLRFGLLFERFLNPERVSMPDFDIDFCQDQRDRVIRHVQEKYGHDKVAQIITFGKLQARAVLRDVGRVLEMPYSQVDRICKLVPNNPAHPVNLEQAIAGEPQLQKMIAEEEAVTRLFAIARPLEGLYRHASTHAAGVVIGDRPLEDLIPLYRDPRSDMPVTGFNMKFVESAGLVKFDFLGLKTLTVLARAVELLAGRGISIDLSRLPLDDAATFRLLGRGETTGVFQLESAGMRDVLRKLRPDNFEDIIAIGALYRPGPMDNIPSYIRRKHGKEAPDYLYPTLEEILKETYGIIIYQEQVMQIAQVLSGYTLGGADLLRRAMGKKIKSEMDLQRQTFFEGAVARGVPKSKATAIFDLVAKFAGYGFNKSHAAAYALVAYQTAYLKANHPVEFMAASMTLDMHNTDKLSGYRQELGRLGISLLPPDVNASDVAFAVETDAENKGTVRYALAAIRNVGEGAMRALVEERRKNGPFEGLADLINRIDPHVLNKRQLENLVRAGALDSLHDNRRQLFEAGDSLLRYAAAAAEDRISNQMGLFGESGGVVLPDMPDVPDWSPMDRLREEFEAIGFYLSAHPLDAYGKTLARLGVQPVAEILAEGRSRSVSLAGTVVAKKERTSGRGNRFAFVQFSDASGVFEVTAFSEVLAASRDLLEVGNSLLVKATAQFDGEDVRFTAQSLAPLAAAAAQACPGLKLSLRPGTPLARIRDTLKRGGKGRGRVQLLCNLEDGSEVKVVLSEGYAVSPAVLFEMRDIPGILNAEEI